MRKMIREFIEPTKKEKRYLWDHAVFVFDTNVLLNLYRYSATTRKSLFAAFKSFQDRLWIPYQVAYEFMCDRCQVIFETVLRYDKFSKEIKTFTDRAIELLRLTPDDSEISDLTHYLSSWLENNKKNNLLVTDTEEDEILTEILEIFDKKVGDIIDDTELSAIRDEGKKRFDKSIPPGFMDMNKKKEQDDNNTYGDLIIWKQILKYAKDKKVGIIFVTHDQKEDWWNTINGKTIGPRIELRREFINETHQKFHMYTMNSFISTYNEINAKKIEKRAVAEISNFEIYNNLNLSRQNELIERISRTEEVINNIESRIRRRRLTLSSINRKYQNRDLECPPEIQLQYDNTKIKISELECELNNQKKLLIALKHDIRNQDVHFINI